MWSRPRGRGAKWRAGAVTYRRTCPPSAGNAHPEHVVAGPEDRHARADGFDDSGHVEAEGEGRYGSGGEHAALAGLPVGGVHTRRTRPDQDLAAARLRPRRLDDLQDVGASGPLLGHGAHVHHRARRPRRAVRHVDDGDVLTSAGVAAGIDLCLHIVRLDHSSHIANEVARSCLVPPWRDGGQAQYIRRPVPGPSTGSTAATRAWAAQRLADPLTLAGLAAHAHMSVRTFSRRFRDEAGSTPGQWLTRQRVDLAGHFLETTDWPVDLVARRAGLGTGASLRQHLHSAIGVSPQAYRRTFRPRRTAV